MKDPKYLRLPITELAKHTPYSYSHLSMLFKKYTGKTIVSHLQELKLIRAKELLRNTDNTISEIIVELNYESLSNFTHTFKKFTGLSPSEFRKSSSDF
jgi:two-component system response regulator YesN